MAAKITDQQAHQLEIIKVLTPYLMALPHSKVNSGTLAVYSKALSNLTLGEIDAAMLKLMRTVKFFPTIAEIFSTVEELKKFLQIEKVKTADEAWQEVMEEISRAYLYKKPIFSSTEIGQVVKKFGWRNLCNVSANNVNFTRDQFMTMYDSVIHRHDDEKINRDVIKSLPKARLTELIAITGTKINLLGVQNENNSGD